MSGTAENTGAVDLSGKELFEFESDFVASLRCIPMAVRYRLDLSGVKLRLNEWSKLSLADKQEFLEKPVSTREEIDAYRHALSVKVAAACGTAPSLLVDLPDALWDSPSLPDQVRDKATAENIPLSDTAWRSLSTLQRFALLKLSRPGHENRNFLPSVREFDLLPD